jgi:RND family efflux transporter MFP subunit
MNVLSEFLHHRKLGVGLCGVLALVLILVFVFRSSMTDKRPATQPVALTVTTTTLEPAELTRSIAATGTVYPWQEIQVGSELAGHRVTAVHVDVGDRVRAGQELVRLQDDLLAAEVASRRAHLQQAEATLANANAAFNRAQSLSVSGALSAADLDRLQSEKLAAAAQVEVAKAELAAAELRLRYTRVLAPDDGIVTARNVSLGQISQAGDEMLRILRKGRVEWRAEVPEARLKEIRRGQRVRLMIADGTQFEGRVRTVAPTIQNTNRTGLVYVDIEHANGVRPGMFASGEILTGNEPAQLAPLASVVMQDGYSYVFVLQDGNIVKRRRVETGAIRGNTIEIVSGLDPKERIVERGAGFLKDGDHVDVAITTGAPKS